MNMNPYNEVLSKYNTNLNDEKVAAATEKIIRENFDRNNCQEVYKTILGCIDLTSLRTEDNDKSIAALTKRVNDFESEYLELPNMAAICVFPNRVESVRMNLEVSDIKIAAVAGGFPSAQTLTEVKVAEVALAVFDGADEIDTVLPVGDFLAEDYDGMCQELIEIKGSCREAKLKVILETGALKSASNIKKAALLAIYSGTDFIKTSTGKNYPGATLEAAYVMCQAIKDYFDKTGTRIGFKAAGGIATTADAVKYYTVVESVLGKEWLNKELFRIGASSLANRLISDIAGKEIAFF